MTSKIQLKFIKYSSKQSTWTLNTIRLKLYVMYKERMSVLYQIKAMSLITWKYRLNIW